MAGFDQLGLGDALVANADAEGFDAPADLQRHVIPVLRRGGNAIIRASAGSGVTAAYALAMLDRFHGAAGTRVLVIVATADRAERVARTIALLARGTDARIAALTSAWAAAGGATIVVAAADRLLAAVEASQLKLDDIEAVVVDGVSAIEELSGPETVERIFASLPRDGQRVFIASELTERVRKQAEAHARKAIYFPPRPAVEREAAKPASSFQLRYVVAAADRKADKIARLARAHDTAVTLICRSRRSAHEAERELIARGFVVSAHAYAEFDRAAAAGHVYAYDVPFSSAQLTSALRTGDTVVAERGELAHLKQLADEANIRLEAAGMPPYEADRLSAFRNEIRRAAREEDLEAQLLVLEPLFDELSTEEVAAAASALLRARRPAKAEAPAAKPGVKTWARLFFSVGERDGVRPADIVGAITGESGIRGDDVGKVEIRDTFAVVEVISTAADRVISTMNGTTMKNRSLRVDYDRKTTAGGARAGRPKGRRPAPRAPTRRDN